MSGAQLPWHVDGSEQRPSDDKRDEHLPVVVAEHIVEDAAVERRVAPQGHSVQPRTFLYQQSSQLHLGRACRVIAAVKTP